MNEEKRHTDEESCVKLVENWSVDLDLVRGKRDEGLEDFF